MHRHLAARTLSLCPSPLACFTPAGILCCALDDDPAACTRAGGCQAEDWDQDFEWLCSSERGWSQQPPAGSVGIVFSSHSPFGIVFLHQLTAFSPRKVSCGAFHMAAATAGGQLFTWGDGFGGKLGHGDSTACALPRRVAALSSLQVTCRQPSCIIQAA